VLFYSTLFTVFFRRRYVSWREKFAAVKARFASIKGACFTATMMHAGRYSIRATTKGKRLHSLAIKARGCTALEEGRKRRQKNYIVFSYNK
jgi:hypothetical protein